MGKRVELSGSAEDPHKAGGNDFKVSETSSLLLVFFSRQLSHMDAGTEI